MCPHMQVVLHPMSGHGAQRHSHWPVPGLGLGARRLQKAMLRRLLQGHSPVSTPVQRTGCACPGVARSPVIKRPEKPAAEVVGPGGQDPLGIDSLLEKAPSRCRCSDAAGVQAGRCLSWSRAQNPLPEYPALPLAVFSLLAWAPPDPGPLALPALPG